MAPSGRTQSPDGASRCYPLQGLIHPSSNVTVQESHHPPTLQIMT